MSERWDDDRMRGPDGRREPGDGADAQPSTGEAPESAGDEAFSLRGGLRFLLALAAAFLLLSILCWLVGGPTPQ